MSITCSWWSGEGTWDTGGGAASYLGLVLPTSLIRNDVNIMIIVLISVVDDCAKHSSTFLFDLEPRGRVLGLGEWNEEDCLGNGLELEV